VIDGPSGGQITDPKEHRLNSNWRNRTFYPAAAAVGVPWATPCTARHTYISLQVHARLPPIIVAALAGTSPEVIWRHYSREFDRSRTTKPLPLEAALRAARRVTATAGATTVLQGDNLDALDSRR
jgi:hypothetical protein